MEAALKLKSALFSERVTKIFCYSAVYIGWGTTYLAIKVGTESMGAASFLFMRFLIAALIMLPFLKNEIRNNLSRKEFINSATIGIILLTGGLLPIALAEKDIASNTTALVIASAPICFAIFDVLINKSKLTLRILSSAVLGICGVYVLTINASKEQTFNSRSMVLILIGTIVWCFGSVLSKKMTLPKNSFLNSTIQYSAAGIVLLAVSILKQERMIDSILSFDHRSMIALLYIILIPSIISYSAYLWLIKNEPTEKVSTYAYVNPVIAILSAAIILNEELTKEMIVAFLLIITGVFISFRKSSKGNK